jgi:hypothetical protein
VPELPLPTMLQSDALAAPPHPRESDEMGSQHGGSRIGHRIMLD